MLPTERPWNKRSARELAAASLVLVALALGTLWSGWLTRIDHLVFDLSQRMTAESAPSGVVLVAVDQTSLQAVGRWPWPRQVHAQLLEKICQAGPKAVGLDIAFNEQGDDAAANDALAHAMRACGNVALPVVMEQSHQGGQMLESPPIAQIAKAAAGLGRVSVRLDHDGVARGIDLWEGVGTPGWPLLAQTLLQIGGWRPPAGAVYQKPAATDGQPQTHEPHALVRWEHRLLRFAGPSGTVRSIPASEILRSASPAPALRDKFVLVGATAAGLGDLLPTPVTTDGVAMPGVEILATALSNMRDDRFIVPLAPAWSYALTALLAIVPLLLATRLMPLSGLLATMAWLAGLIAAGVALPLWSGYWFAPAGALVAAIAAYPLWSWRRLEAAGRHLDWQLQQLAGNPGANHPLPPRLSFQQRISQVRLAQQNFQGLQKQREDTLAFLSHDIRAPLAAAVQQLGAGTLDQAGQNALFRQLRRAHKMAQAFLSLAKVESLEQKDLREVDLGAVLHQACDGVYEAAQARALRIARQIPDAPIWVEGNFDLLERAIGNLLHNAVRFAPEGSTITVVLSLEGSEAEISVADQGPGIGPEMQEHLFKRYGSTNDGGRTPQSTGLGLYFVKSVATRHGGRTGHAPVVPSGARFWMRLPHCDK